MSRVFGQSDSIKNSKGVLNLERFDFSKNTYNLDCKWEFYPNKFLTPLDFNSDKNKPEPIYISVPGLWNSNENKHIFGSGEGYGTYHLKIKTKNNKELLAININRIQSSYKLWINSKMYSEQGKVGVNQSLSKPAWSSENYHFFKENSEIEIVIQVANFYHKKGGIENSITIGSSEIIDYTGNKIFGFDIFLVGVILMMGFYHMGMYFLRPKDISALFFSLTMIFSATFSLTTGEIIFTNIFPNLPWEILIKTNYISNYSRLIFFLLFLSSLFPTEYPKKLIRIFKYLIGIIIFLIIFLPAKIYTQTLFIFLIIALISVIIIIAGIIKATYKNLSGAKFSLVGTIFLVSTGVNDLLLEYHIINTISLATLGFFVFVFLQSYMLSLKTSSKYEEERKITKHLSKLSELKDSFLTSNYFEIFKPLEILKNIVEAERIVLIVNENEEWFIKADINEKASSYELQNFDSVTEILNLGFDKDIAMQTIIKKEQSLIQNPKKETLFFPLKDNESVSALIILENNKKDFIFNSEILKLIESTEYQFVTFINTYKIYNQISEINTNLEDKVHTRMSEILEQNEILEKQRDEIEKRNSLLNSAYNRVKLSNLEINDGINYAKKIQNSLLPDKKDVKNLFPKSLIMYKPKDVLSGDFYWTDNILINGKENLFFAVADCTGHGVPGSLMSIVGNNLLSDTIISEKIYDTAEILNSTHSKIIKRLNKEVNGTKFNDTIDIAIIKYIPAENTLQFSGARHPLLLIRNNELIEYKADKKSIGEIRRNQNTEKSTFSSIIIDIKKEDKIFLFSDGYEDQIGGKHVRKFLKKNLLDLILEINSIPFEKQHKILSETLTKWQGNNIQTDDILIAEIEF